MVDPPRRLAAALAGVGVLLCVLGWYQISGQPTVPQQLPYLASATIPGAALLVVGLLLALRTPWPSPRAPRSARGRAGGPSPGEARPSGSALRRVPDGRYLHVADCPLLDGRADVIEVPETDASAAELRSCPLCHAAPPGPRPVDGSPDR